MPCKADILEREVLKRSQSKIFAVALTEWYLLVLYADDHGHCLCTHFPIKDHHVLRNRITGEEIIIGNVCVTKFDAVVNNEQLRPSLVIAAFKRIVASPSTARANAALLADCERNSHLNDWEYSFYNNVYRKRNLTYKQQEQLLRVNNKIIAAYTSK